MQPQIPIRFPADWHHQFGPSLEPFPRSLNFGSPELTYWPDLATFVEDATTAQMMYVPSRASRFSITVFFNRVLSRWQVSKYQDCELAAVTCGESYEQAMAAAIAKGPCSDEWKELLTTAGSD